MEDKCSKAVTETRIAVMKCLSNYLGKHYKCGGCANDVFCKNLKKLITGEVK